MLFMFRAHVSEQNPRSKNGNPRPGFLAGGAGLVRAGLLFHVRGSDRESHTKLD